MFFVIFIYSNICEMIIIRNYKMIKGLMCYVLMYFLLFQLSGYGATQIGEFDCKVFGIDHKKKK